MTSLLKTLSILCAALFGVSGESLAQADSAIRDAIDNPARAESNRERDASRHPEQVLAFTEAGPGDVILDYGAGGGYYSELFSSIVGPDGTVYAQYRAGERFDQSREAIATQLEPFGNIQIFATRGDETFPIGDDSVDAVMVSYLYHHMHYDEAAGESLPDGTVATLAEFERILKPGGTLVVIEHVAAEGASREQSAAWHRTPPETARADITGAGFEFVAEATDIYFNPDDDLRNVWYETGLSGNTTSFVHRYRARE